VIAFWGLLLSGVRKCAINTTYYTTVAHFVSVLRVCDFTPHLHSTWFFFDSEQLKQNRHLLDMSKGFSLFNQKLREKIGVVSSDSITKNDEVDELSRKTESMVHHLSKLTGELSKSFKSSQSNSTPQLHVFVCFFSYENISTKFFDLYCYFNYNPILRSQRDKLINAKKFLFSLY
jgi:hypothetical protein